MSGDTMGGVQGVLVLSWHRTEVLQGHQALTSSQDLWILLGSKGAGPPCTHGHPKAPHHWVNSSLSTCVLDTHCIKSIYELLS